MQTLPSPLSKAHRVRLFATNKDGFPVVTGYQCQKGRSMRVEEKVDYFKTFRTELILVLALVFATLVGGITLIIREGAVFHDPHTPSAPAAMPHADSDTK